MKPSDPTRPSPDADDTGLPLLRTWKSVYLFVLGTFALWVGLSIALTRMYS